MLSDKQIKQMIDTAKNIGDYFLQNPDASNIEIANALGLTPSTVQRFLGDGTKPGTSYYNYMTSAGYTSEHLNTMRNYIKLNLHNAKVKGGLTSQSKNNYIIDEDGKFNGSVKK